MALLYKCPPFRIGVCTLSFSNLFVDLQILSVFILKVKWKKIRCIFDT